MVNKKRRKKINKGIEIKEWVEYFRGLLSGVGEKVRGTRGTGGEKGRADSGRDKRAVKRIKERRAVGQDEIPGKVWRVKVGKSYMKDL